ncbi:hypothetical protein TNCV_3264541 [Trichonephila clavipes]|nr:hypothetical protein TNCV_3264541 [Trichonephila clavipes]
MIVQGLEVGARVYYNHFAINKPAVGRDTTNFNGEVEAFFIALNQLSVLKSNFPRAVNLSDINADLRAMSKNKVCTSKRIYECRKIPNSLEDLNVLQWIPAHCGIERNERADFLEKKGMTILKTTNKHMTFNSSILIKLEFKMMFVKLRERPRSVSLV